MGNENSTNRHPAYMRPGYIEEDEGENSIDEFFTKKNGLITPEIAVKWRLKGLTHAFDWVDKEELKMYSKERRKSFKKNKKKHDEVKARKELEKRGTEREEALAKEAEALKQKVEKSHHHHRHHFKHHRQHLQRRGQNVSIVRSETIISSSSSSSSSSKSSDSSNASKDTSINESIELKPPSPQRRSSNDYSTLSEEEPHHHHFRHAGNAGKKRRSVHKGGLTDLYRASIVTEAALRMNRPSYLHKILRGSQQLLPEEKAFYQRRRASNTSIGPHPVHHERQASLLQDQATLIQELIDETPAGKMKRSKKKHTKRVRIVSRQQRRGSDSSKSDKEGKSKVASASNQQQRRHSKPRSGRRRSSQKPEIIPPIPIPSPPRKPSITKGMLNKVTKVTTTIYQRKRWVGSRPKAQETYTKKDATGTATGTGTTTDYSSSSKDKSAPLPSPSPKPTTTTKEDMDKHTLTSSGGSGNETDDSSGRDQKEGHKRKKKFTKRRSKRDSLKKGRAPSSAKRILDRAEFESKNTRIMRSMARDYN